MGNNKNKRYGAGLLAASLVIGLSIGFCAGYAAGGHSAANAENEGPQQIMASEQISENGQDIDDAANGESENAMGPFAVDMEPVLTIGTTTIYLDEINARVYMARDQYVSLYGEEPWNMETDEGMTVGEYAKKTMLDEMERVTILCEQAGNYEGMALSEEELLSCENQAEDYMAALGTEVAGQFSVTKNAMCSIYEKDALAMKVYNRILEELTESLRAEEAYKDLDESDFETVLMEKFNEKYQSWKDQCQIRTTETWEQLVIGAVG